MYLDTNIFIFATTNRGRLGKTCREIIGSIDDGRLRCSASCVMIDEVLWVLSRKIGKDKAIKAVKGLLSLPVRWIPYDRDIVVQAVDIFSRTRMDPRDAIHLATMRDSGLSTVISEDSDFEGISGIERIGAGECLTRLGL